MTTLMILITNARTKLLEMKLQEKWKNKSKAKKIISYLYVISWSTGGLSEIEDDVWRLQFLDIVLGHYDALEDKFAPMKEIVRL